MNYLRYKGLTVGIILLLFQCSKEKQTCPFDIDTVDFNFGINYDKPENYLVPGEQSDLSDANFEFVRKAIGIPDANLEGIRSVCHWVNQNFTFENAGGAMIGKNTVDELFEMRTFYGCHSLSLVISSILRKFGFPAIMIETADVKWGYDFHSGAIDYMKGHVMTEVYVILLDNNCTYISDYDPHNPYISAKNEFPKGLFALGKGVDIWGYTDGNSEFTNIEMNFFSDNIYCYEELFYTISYDWRQ